MLKIEFSSAVFPPHLEGQWKILEDIFIDGDSRDCFTKRAEVLFN